MKILARFALTFAALLFLSSTAQADGNFLLESCIQAEHFFDNPDGKVDHGSVGYCMGFTQGVRNTMEMMKLINSDYMEKVCFPKANIKNDQGVRIVLAYLKKNLALLHMKEIVLTMTAYAEAYQCK